MPPRELSRPSPRRAGRRQAGRRTRRAFHKPRSLENCSDPCVREPRERDTPWRDGRRARERDHRCVRRQGEKRSWCTRGTARSWISSLCVGRDPETRGIFDSGNSQPPSTLRSYLSWPEFADTVSWSIVRLVLVEILDRLPTSMKAEVPGENKFKKFTLSRYKVIT